MSIWGKTDNANNSPFFGPLLVNKKANTANRNAMFGNTTTDSFVTGQKVGVFGVAADEVKSTGPITGSNITSAGSGYTANVGVNVGAANVALAVVTSGKVSSFTANASAEISSKYSPVIDAPPAITFNANSGVTANSIVLGASQVFANGDILTYTVAAGNTSLSTLTSGNQYYVVGANSTAISLSATSGGSLIPLTKGLTESGHSVRGQRATANFIVSGGFSQGVAHTGWVLRREGTGGRAGRVTIETLVACGITNDAEDTSFPE